MDPNKVHGYDKISIPMIKTCTSSISKSLAIFFRNCFEVPVHKRNDKQLTKNYQPVSLLLICSKMFEKVIFNSPFKYLDDNNLFTSKQSGFHPGDSYVHQLLSVTYELYKAFDAKPSLDVK